MIATLPISDSVPLCALAHLVTRDMPAHERASHAAVVAQIATLMGLMQRDDVHWQHDGLADIQRAGRVYWVPTDTLIGGSWADVLDISHPSHLFGGVVPFPFVETKAITHPLVGPHAVAPLGWSEAFGQHVASAVLPGWTVFSQIDALEACKRLLIDGPVRVKPVHGRAGRGQSVIHHVDELLDVMSDIEADSLAQCGLVLEAHLEDVITFSVGHVQIGEFEAAYVGTQCLTRANDGASVYGGSTLDVVRGGFEHVLAGQLQADERRAIEQAQRYDAAAFQYFPGMVASRRNYDMVTGRDGRGQRVSGVLEQSWRIGGASGAELAALLAFQQDPALNRIRASTVERYGGTHQSPPGAMVTYDGEDAHCGKLIKYVTTEGL